jgi:hypothetical protein
VTPLQALQAALAGEHAAVYLYGVAGGRLSASAYPALATRVRSGYVAHRGRRDRLTLMVRDAGGDPVAAAVGYRLDNPARTVDQLTRLARETESRAAEQYAQLAGSSSGETRRWAVDALVDASVRLMAFGGSPSAFPGLPEL